MWEKIVNFARHVKIREERFGSVIFETLKEKVYVTNQTGSEILKLIKEGLDKEDIISDLCDTYDADINRINDEVGLFIDQLREKELIAE